MGFVKRSAVRSSLAASLWAWGPALAPAVWALEKPAEPVVMPVREKGPLFVVYPLDSRSELRSQVYYTLSAWQLARLVVQ